jgi:hypothetical protein
VVRAVPRRQAPLARGRRSELLEEEDADVVFVDGCEDNQGVFHPRFDGAGELQKILKDEAELEPHLRRVAHHEVVTTAPLEDVVAEVLRIAAKL